MFEDYSQKFKRKWGKIFHDGQEAIERALGAAAEENGCTIQKCGNDFLWKNRKNQSEALFRFIPDSTDISLFQDIYRKIEQTRSPITFVVVHQTVDGEGNYDKSYEDEIEDLPLTPSDIIPIVYDEKISADAIASDDYIPTNSTELMRASNTLVDNFKDELGSKEIELVWKSIKKIIAKVN